MTTFMMPHNGTKLKITGKLNTNQEVNIIIHLTINEKIMANKKRICIGNIRDNS